MTDEEFDLDTSWDDDLSDLPDLMGLDVADFEALEDVPDEELVAEAHRASMKLGGGGRFAKLKSALGKKGASNPGALAAYIGRKKYGKAKFQKLASKARGKSSRNEGAEHWAGAAHEPRIFVRTEEWPLEECRIRSGGDGRTVEAYAAVFDVPTPVYDQDGKYEEIVDRGMFTRSLSQSAPNGNRKNWRVGVFYNHGRTIWDTPSERHSVPLGLPLEIKPDNRGLYTLTRFSRSEMAEEILEAIKDGSIAGYSFSGAFLRSDPTPPLGGFRPDGHGRLRSVRRLEATLREYGPTPFPAYKEAAVVGTRAEQAFAVLASLPETERQRFAQLFTSGAPASAGLAPEDSRPLRRETRSGRAPREELRAQRSRFLQRYPEGPPNGGYGGAD